MEKVKVITQKRGQLTDRIKIKSKELLGYEICTIELRLMPYLQYLVTNSKGIDGEKINSQELGIFTKWYKLGYTRGTLENIKITKKFWSVINELIYLGYVDLIKG